MDISRPDEADFNNLCSIIQNTKKNILLHGPGGCGKSFLIRKVRKRFNDMNIAVTATTGIAALQIGGVTIHSWSGIGIMIPDRKKMLGRIYNRPECVDRIKSVDLLVIDEISMFGQQTIEMLNYLFQEIRRSISPFGGVRVLFSGDFLQLPPVKDEWAFKSKVWKQLRLVSMSLTTPKRYSDLDYFNILLRVRSGKPTPSDISFLHSRVKAYEDRMAMEDAMTEEEKKTSVTPTVLFSKKMDVATFNKRCMSKLDGVEYTYLAYDSFEAYKRGTSSKYYESRLDDGIPKSITLKVGAQVMLKKNLDVGMGLVNGSRGVVTGLNDEQVTVKFVSGLVQTVSRKTWKVEDDNGLAMRSQIPFILAWALTVHSTQGCTIDLAICDCGASIFACGQAYVSISRVRSKEGLFLLEFIPRAIMVDKDALRYSDGLNPEDGEFYEDETSSDEENESTQEETPRKAEAEVDILKLLNIDTKLKWKKWLTRNHPDKGGDVELCQRIISAGKAKFGD